MVASRSNQTATAQPAPDEAAVSGSETEHRRRVPAFEFGVDDAEPELPLRTGAAAKATANEVETGVDLTGKPKVMVWIGRGKTGKTTGLRWVAEKVLSAGREMLMADMDSTNDTFSQYIDGVARPPDAADPMIALKWLDRLLQHAMQHKVSVLVDLGGGDTVLRRLVAQLPDLVPMLEAAGFAVVAVYAVGPQEEDLSPLATLEGLGFQPKATTIVLNEGLVEVGDAPAQAFARVFRHSVFRAAAERGAVPVWMPKLLVASQVETRRLHYGDAAAGQVGQGTTPLGPFDRARVANWLRQMDANFSGIMSWMP